MTTNDELLKQWLETNEIKKLRTLKYTRPAKLTGIVSTKPRKPRKKRVKSKNKNNTPLLYKQWFKTNFIELIEQVDKHDEFFKQINKYINVPLFNRYHGYVIELTDLNNIELTRTKKKRLDWYKKKQYLVLEVLLFNNDSLRDTIKIIKDLTTKK